MASVFFSNAQRIIAQIFEWLQSSLQTRVANLITDTFQTGIDKSTSSGEGFLVVPGTNNTAAAPTVNVTLGGIAYDPLGNRIFISPSDTTLYNEANVTETTNDGLGNQILTPQSSGVINIPVTQNSANYIWIDYLATTNTLAFTLNEITNAKIFYEITDGYNIQVTTTNVPPDANSVFLASVTTTGTAVSSGQISQVGRVYYALLPGLISETGVGEGTQFQLAYYPSTGTGVVGNPNVMVGDEVVVTDINGVPTTTGNGSTSATEIGYVHGVTSSIQTQLNAKFAAAGTGLTSSGATVAVANGGIAGSTSNTGTQQQIEQGTIGTIDLRTSSVNGSTANSGGTAQQIAQGTISTPDFRANAVTNMVQSQSTSVTFSGTTIATVTITTIGKPVLLSWSVCLIGQTAGSGPSYPIGFQTNVNLDGTAVAGTFNQVLDNMGGNASGEQGEHCACGTTIVTPSAGTHTFTYYYAMTGTTTFVAIQNYTLTAVEIRA
jgi:hypothetical protein